MGMPANWREKGTLPNGTEDEPIGHQDQGSTIAVHSLAVLSEHHGKGVGTTLMKAYLQRIKDAEIAERIALLSHEDLVPFYTALGFENLGVSDVKFGSRPWFSMVSSRLTASVSPLTSVCSDRVLENFLDVGSQTHQ
jgi:GNAT superfamily N-acetyltransferase